MKTVKLEQFKKAFSPMLMICVGTRKADIPVHPLNWLAPMTALFSVTLVSEVQFSKTEVPMLVTV